MLKSLSIKNYAIIENLTFEPGNTLNVITGETGAGKSILLGALGLVLGNRAELDVLKDKSKKCVVEAVFDIEKYGLKPFFEHHELDFHPHLIVRREILPAGKSRAFVNDTPAKLDVLQKLSALLVDLHQQFSSLDIYQSSYQLNLLDAMAENRKLFEEYQKVWTQWMATNKELQELIRQEEEATKEYDFLEFQYKELEEAKIEEGEVGSLEEELKSLDNFGLIKESMAQVINILEEGDRPINDQINNLAAAVNQSAEVHADCKKIGERLNGVAIELEDLVREVAVINENLEFDPDRLEFLNNRLDTLYRLQKKHQLNSSEELIQLMNELEQKLEAYNSIADRINELEQEAKELKSEVIERGGRLTKSRINAAGKLEKQCMEILRNLSMPHARLKIGMVQRQNPGADGMDELRFLFSANKGVDFKDLRDVASGGEISRLNLAIKSIIAGKIHLPTLIFDEIDSGVGGDVALKMGRILNQTARDHQIVVITHSPQVAASGSNHFFIHKTTQGNVTRTHLRKLEGEDRLHHIAVMLSTEPPTEAALANAKELIHLN